MQFSSQGFLTVLLLKFLQLGWVCDLASFPRSQFQLCCLPQHARCSFWFLVLSWAFSVYFLQEPRPSLRCCHCTSHGNLTKWQSEHVSTQKVNEDTDGRLQKRLAWSQCICRRSHTPAVWQLFLGEPNLLPSTGVFNIILTAPANLFIYKKSVRSIHPLPALLHTALH
jgi:hypothetical protein